MNRTNETIGFVAGFLATLAFVPQVMKLWLMRPAPAVAISLPMYVAFVAGVGLWLVYGVRIKKAPIIVWNAITLVLATSVLTYKLIYG